ncbi:MAG: hypothetical protein D6707_11820 [Bacteroidetes bacterium]|nr:MAG: hypothetical protein D6707_11820 [Bacteroidota bacterium]
MGTGPVVGITQQLTGNTTTVMARGMDNIINSNGEAIGVFNAISNDNTTASGSRTVGIFNQLNGNTTDTVSGVFNIVNNAGSGVSFGIYSKNISNAGGDQYGVYNKMYNSGTGDKYGTYNYMEQTGPASNKFYGTYDSLIHSGSGPIYAMYATLTGAAVKYGVYVTGEDYNYFSGRVGIGTANPTFPLHVNTSTELRAGYFVNSTSSSLGKFGVYANASGGGSGNNVGGWFDASGSATGINYGVAGQALGTAGENRAVYGAASGGTTNWAGYFELGNVYIADSLGIGTTSPTEKLDVNGNVIIPGTNDYKYSSPKTRYYSVPANTFTSERGSSYDVNYVSGAAYVPNGVIGVTAYLEAPVNLPDGAQITQVDFILEDNSVYDFSTVQIWAKNLNDGSTAYRSVTPTTGTYAIQPFSITSFVSFPNTIDNNQYAYYLRVGTIQTDNKLLLHGVRIIYTVTKAD